MDLDIRKKEDGTFVVDMTKLEEAIQKGQIDAIKSQIKEALTLERADIFPDSQGRFLQRKGTIVDTSFFRKDYRSMAGGGMRDASELPFMLASSGGPFIKLSPAMEKFVECLKLRFDVNRMASKGINFDAYQKEIADWNKKDTATGLTIADAGALVPIEFLATVIEFATAQSQILPKLWRIPMGSTSMRIPTLAQAAGSYFGGIVLYHPDEVELKPETKPSFSYKSFEAQKTIGIIPISDALIMDSAINVINYVTGIFVRAFQYNAEGEVVKGTGTNGQMLGIVTDPLVNIVARQTNGLVKYDDIINLESALDENFQDLTWLSRRVTVNTLRKQKDTAGQPVYRYEWPMNGMGASILEYPVVKTRNVPALGLKGDIILGDLGYYIWAIRQDMTIDISKDARFFYDETCVRFVMRMDGKPGVSIAFAILNSTPDS
jgi:HK97 family phage major capsid protein